MYVCMYVRMYVCMYVCMYTYIHTYIHTYVRTYIHTYIHTYIYIYIYIYISLSLYIYRERERERERRCFSTPAHVLVHPPVWCLGFLVLWGFGLCLRADSLGFVLKCGGEESAKAAPGLQPPAGPSFRERPHHMNNDGCC